MFLNRDMGQIVQLYVVKKSIGHEANNFSPYATQAHQNSSDAIHDK